MNLYNTYIDILTDELITEGFTWTDWNNQLHIYLPSLKERLEAVGLTITELPKDG